MGSQTFMPRDYDVFGGLDADKKSISVTFTDHQGSLVILLIFPFMLRHSKHSEHYFNSLLV